MFKITYTITDAKDVEYKGEFVTFVKTPRRISAKICSKHPQICVPFKSYDIKVNKV